MGFDFLATGHYAKIVERKGKYFLARPRDRHKDQTYFLYGISPDILSRVLFPLAGYTKDQTRTLACRAGLSVAEKEQSQDICFIRGRNYKEFINKHGYRPKPGDIVTLEGKALGRHQGLAYFTRGQRSGLKIASKEPLYVIDFDLDQNRIIVGAKARLRSSIVLAKDLNWFKEPGRRLEAKIRYAHTPAACCVQKRGNSAKVVFKEPQEAITPGQSIVFYDGNSLVGGGIIESAVFACL
jgi:tRNA-specific 2-thiouridylase